MARQYMTKEVTTTTIKSGKIIINPEGKPEVNPMQDIIVLGSISETKAHKTVNRAYGVGTTIYAVEEETKTYRMRVEDFIKVAELVTDTTPKEDLEDGTEDDEENDNEDHIPEHQDLLSSTKVSKGETNKAKIKIIPKEPIET
jgi:hypothetical protein